MPAEARVHENKMHGCFCEDADTGVVYTGIPGWGLAAISADLKEWHKISADKRLEGNIHGLCVFKQAGETVIACAMNMDEKILIVGLDGVVRQELRRPKGNEFSFAPANSYYAAVERGAQQMGFEPGKVFSATDATFLDGMLYVVTGYCEGDFVLTARPGPDGAWAWGPIAWGGKGDEPGQFKTAHGVFAHQGCIYVANREAHEVCKFDARGTLLEKLPAIPSGSRICNLSHAADHGWLVMNALEPVQWTQVSAPIYAYAGASILSTIVPGDLGIPKLRHVHQAYPHYVTDPNTGQRTLYLLVHGWNEGRFAVLKHEPGVA